MSAEMSRQHLAALQLAHGQYGGCKMVRGSCVILYTYCALDGCLEFALPAHQQGMDDVNSLRRVSLLAVMQ